MAYSEQRLRSWQRTTNNCLLRFACILLASASWHGSISNYCVEYVQTNRRPPTLSNIHLITEPTTSRLVYPYWQVRLCSADSIHAHQLFATRAWEQDDAVSPHGYFVVQAGAWTGPPHPSAPLWIHPVAGFSVRPCKQTVTSLYTFVSPQE